MKAVSDGGAVCVVGIYEMEGGGRGELGGNICGIRSAGSGLVRMWTDRDTRRAEGLCMYIDYLPFTHPRNPGELERFSFSRGPHATRTTPATGHPSSPGPARATPSNLTRGLGGGLSAASDLLAIHAHPSFSPFAACSATRPRRPVCSAGWAGSR